MNVYFDAANVAALAQNQGEENFNEVIKMLKTELNVNFNFQKESIRNNHLIVGMLKKHFTQGVKTALKWDSDFPERPLKSNCTNSFNFDQLTSTYLLSGLDVIKVKNKGSVLIGEENEELVTLNKLVFNDQFKYSKKWNIGCNTSKNKKSENIEIRGWDELLNINLPTTDIVIVDPWIFKHINGCEDPIKENYVKFFHNLALKSKSSINLVIVTDPDNVNINIEDALREIKMGLEKTTGLKPKITVVKTKKEHDRQLLTNYFHITSGNKFMFWNEKGRRLVKRTWILYESLADNRQHEIAKDDLMAIQKTIDNIYEKGDLNNIIGDKKSGFLKFKD